MAQENLSTGTGFSGPAFSPNPQKTPKRTETEYEGEVKRRLERSRGKGEPFNFSETNCQRRLGRSLPGQNPGQRKVVEIRESKCRARGKGNVTLTLLHASKSLVLRSSTATVSSAAIAGSLLRVEEKVLSPRTSLLPCSLL